MTLDSPATCWKCGPDPSRPRQAHAGFPLASSLLLCESHGRLRGKLSFQNNLLALLPSRDRRFDQPDPVSVISAPASAADDAAAAQPRAKEDLP